jgi:hypothetical protein
VSNYLDQQLYLAICELVGDEPLDLRLTHAADRLVPVQPKDIPELHRDEFETLKAALSKTELSSSRGFVPRQVSAREAKTLALKFVDLYADVLKGGRSP